MSRCRVPPPGWYCTRRPGHNGPCAALPDRREPNTDLEDLTAWKAKAILRKIDFQAIGKEIGLPVGSEVAGHILPELIARTQHLSLVTTIALRIKADFDRLDRKYGENWREWEDVREDIAALLTVIAAPGASICTCTQIMSGTDYNRVIRDPECAIHRRT